MEDPTPLVQKFFLHLPAPSLRDNTAEVDRLKKQVLAAGGFEHLDVPLAQIPRWVTVLRKSAYRVTATVDLSGIVPRLIEVDAGDTRTGLLGLAVDLGTTRIACQLWDLHQRILIGEIDRQNPQVRFGADILTRIQVAERPEGLQELRECVVEEINRAMAELAGEHSLSTRDLYALTLAGNTTMVHLFLGLDPSTIRREPYIPIINALDPLSALELGLAMHPRGTVVIFPQRGQLPGGRSHFRHPFLQAPGPGSALLAGGCGDQRRSGPGQLPVAGGLRRCGRPGPGRRRGQHGHGRRTGGHRAGAHRPANQDS